MSLVSDALKKAEQMRLERAGVLGPGQRTVVRARSLHAGRLSADSAKWWWANAVVLAVAAVMAVQYWRQPQAGGAGEAASAGATTVAETRGTERSGTASNARDAVAAADDASGAASEETAADANGAGEPLPGENAAVQPARAEAEYVLTGVTVAGANTLVGVTRQSDGRSAWIAVGQTLGDVTVVSYDAEKEQATLRVDGQLVTVGMRSGGW